MTLGNPTLEPAITQNYDVYASVYQDHIGLFTAGYFHKEIDNLSCRLHSIRVVQIGLIIESSYPPT